MTAVHPASGQPALFALCGELVVAINAMMIREVRRAAETPTRSADRGMSLLDLDGDLVPGWDLGALLGIEATPTAWAILEAPSSARWIGLRLGRCVTVQALPVCRALPPGIFTNRPGAIAAAFSTAAIPELADHVSGVVVEPVHLLGEREHAAMAKLSKGGRAAALEA